VNAQYYGPSLAGYTTETTNEPGRHLDYQGLEVGAEKRWARRWSASGSLTLQSSTDHYPPGSYQNPTNIAAFDGHAGDVSLPRYVSTITGRVALPWDIGAAVSAHVRDGFIRDIVLTGPSNLTFALASGGAIPGNTTTLLIAPQGTTRYPKVATVDLQCDRTIVVGARARLVLTAVVFNALNAGTVLTRVSNLSLTTYDQITDMLGPRVLRVGVRIDF